MYIVKNKDFRILLELELYLYNNNINEELYLKLHDLNKRILKEKEVKTMAQQIYFNKEKINTLIKMENLIMQYSKDIFGENKDKKIEVKWYNGDITTITYDDYMQFNNIIEKLIIAHKQNIKKQNEYKKEKRKTNKMFGRSRKEIERYNKKKEGSK